MMFLSIMDVHNLYYLIRELFLISNPYPKFSTILILFILFFRYVAPEYANSGLLNEKSDVYSFGVLLLEAITGRDPVDYGRPAPEVCTSFNICYIGSLFKHPTIPRLCQHRIIRAHEAR